MGKRINAARGLLRGVAAAASLTLVLPALAQATAGNPPTLTLQQAFDAAWARQPEAAAVGARRSAARAQQQAAQSWWSDAAVEVSNRADRLNPNQGLHEVQVGLSVPIPLPGERARASARALAEGRSVESRALAVQLQLAATLREAWWQWQRARGDLDMASAQLQSTQRIAADVARRVKAGDLARADQHQADGALAAAESALAQAQANGVAARQQLRAIVGTAPPDADPANPVATEAEPDAMQQHGAPDGHAALHDLSDRAALAEREAELVDAQTRTNPELTLAVTRERASTGDPYRHSLTLGARIPLGNAARHSARSASARAEADALRAQLAVERERSAAESESARARVDATRTQLAAAQRRAQLALESRGFFDKSFRLGETDLPTRLRIEAEAAEAQRQAARSRIELAAAVSQWRQALGLLPR